MNEIINQLLKPSIPDDELNRLLDALLDEWNHIPEAERNEFFEVEHHLHALSKQNFSRLKRFE